MVGWVAELNLQVANLNLQIEYQSWKVVEAHNLQVVDYAGRTKPVWPEPAETRFRLRFQTRFRLRFRVYSRLMPSAL